MPEILRSPVPLGLKIAAEIRPVFAPISSSFHGKPQATAFPGIHRIPARTPTDQPAVGARLAVKRRIDFGADPEQDAGLILTPVPKPSDYLKLQRLHLLPEEPPFLDESSFPLKESP